MCGREAARFLLDFRLLPLYWFFRFPFCSRSGLFPATKPLSNRNDPMRSTFGLLLLLVLWTPPASGQSLGILHSLYFQQEENSIFYTISSFSEEPMDLFVRYSLETHEESILFGSGSMVAQVSGLLNQEPPATLTATGFFQRATAAQSKMQPLLPVDLQALNLSFQARIVRLSGRELDDEQDGIRPEDWEEPGMSLTWNTTPWLAGHPQKSLRLEACVESALSGMDFKGFSLPGKDFLFVIARASKPCAASALREEAGFALTGLQLPEEVFLQLDTSRPQQRLKAFEPAHGGLHQEMTTPLQLAKAMNTVGFRAYRAGLYELAIRYFAQAYASQESLPWDEKYLLPLFNLAATEARLGKTDAALGHLEELLSTGEERSRYRTKVQRDSDFDSLRDSPGYQLLMGP